MAAASDLRRALDLPVAGQIACRPVADHLSLVLRILWVNYALVVVVDLTVWLALDVGSPDPEYFWPIGMLVPGVLLAGATTGVNAVRKDRPAR